MIEIAERFIAEYHDRLGLSRAPSKISMVKMGGRQDRFSSVPFACFLNGRSYPTFYVKFPRDPTNLKRIKTEFYNLRKIRRKAKSEIIRNSIPAPLWYNETPVFSIQSAVAGTPMLSEINRKNFSEMSGDALAWLTRFHKETKMRQVDYQKYFRGETEKLKREVGAYSKSAADFFARCFKRGIEGNAEVSITHIHGDFNPHNIVIDDEKLAVFDLEESSIGPPFIDVYHYFTVSSFSVDFRRSDRELSWEERYRKYFLKNTEKILSIIRDNYSMLPIDENFFVPTYIFYLAYMAANEIRRDQLINYFELWANLLKMFVAQMKSWSIQ